MNGFIRQVVVIVACVTFVSACGAADGGPSDGEAPVDPLAELLGWGTNTSPAEQRTKQLAVEESVQVCMRAEGFEYTPVDYDAQFAPDEEDIALYSDPEAFGEKYGYGVVRNYEQWEEPYLSGDGEGLGGPVFEDPNQEYVDSLSEGEREEYYRILHGEQTYAEEPLEAGEEGDTVYESPPVEEQGCYGKANFEIYNDQFTIDPEIEARLSDFYNGFQDDPELAAADQDWLDCMQKQDDALLESDVEGFEVTKPDLMYQLVDFAKMEAMGQTIIDYESDGQGGSSYGSDGETTTTPIPDDELEALRRFELDLWKIDWKCQEDADIPGIRLRMQQRLADELRADFPELSERDG